MPEALRRVDLQKLAESKIEDASLLIKHGRYANAFYLAGYSIELGLKACVARHIRAEEIPDKRLINDVYVHDLDKLVGVAGLRGELTTLQKADPSFAANWAIVGQWSEAARYEATDAYTSQVMMAAIQDPQRGILQWIRKFW